MSERVEAVLLYGLLVAVLAGLAWTLYSAVTPVFTPAFAPAGESSHHAMGASMSRMSMTEFDKKKARQLMDKDNDGKCDACGMPVEMCLDGGEMECSMDTNAKIGALGTQHIHADWRVYVDGKVVDFSDYAHMQRMQEGKSVSSFIHVDSGSPEPEKTGDVLHMHATGVPLKLFFESLGMKFDKDCLTISASDKYCTDDRNALKFYVNGKPQNPYGDYVFKDLDKILISYGPKEDEVSQQLASITSFAGLH
ncbi:hypothetical protein HY642_02640 [Candidatus Woesearchaeota archaeon]|nr:hypothetical protein [Candidatus Woesearchaeota archaeon]